MLELKRIPFMTEGYIFSKILLDLLLCNKSASSEAVSLSPISIEERLLILTLLLSSKTIPAMENIVENSDFSSFLEKSSMKVRLKLLVYFFKEGIEDSVEEMILERERVEKSWVSKRP